MSATNDDISSRLLAKLQAATGPLQLRRKLSIAVLGPGLGSPLSAGGKKRTQIRDALLDDGHLPFFPEERGILHDPLGETLLDQGRQVLSDPGVDLIVVLHTRDSAGVMGELYRYYDVPEIESKMAVMVPIELYNPQGGVFGDIILRYRTRFPYNKFLFETCELVSECRMWAKTMAMGEWPVRSAFQV